MPRSRWISLGEIADTVPQTTSPVFKVLRDSSSICAKFSVVSLMFLSTSLITLYGVDAPAVMDTVLLYGITISESPEASSMRYVRSQTELHIS